MSDWLELSGRPAMVVGAGGLGGAAATRLAAEGAEVLLLDRDEGALDAVAQRAQAFGAPIAVDVCDVSSAEGSREAVERAVTRIGTPQIFMHAVGRNVRRPVLELGDDDWDDLLTLNLSTAWWLGRAVGGRMVAAGYGRMVFLSSVSGLLAHAHHAPYAASKGGLNQLMRVMAREWASSGVTVNAVAPGYVETPLTRAYLDTDDHRLALEAMVPSGRLGRPEEVADAMCFLASDRAAFVTGHVLYVDGGRSLV